MGLIRQQHAIYDISIRSSLLSEELGRRQERVHRVDEGKLCLEYTVMSYNCRQNITSVAQVIDDSNDINTTTCDAQCNRDRDVMGTVSIGNEIIRQLYL